MPTIETMLELPVELEFDYYPEVAAHLSGLPEDSIPCEQETLDIVSVKIGNIDVIGVLSLEQMDELENAALVHVFNEAKNQK